ncbi:unnamed protein product, partial [marine sediment metagenome]
LPDIDVIDLDVTVPICVEINNELLSIYIGPTVTPLGPKFDYKIFIIRIFYPGQLIENIKGIAIILWLD